MDKNLIPLFRRTFFYEYLYRTVLEILFGRYAVQVRTTREEERRESFELSDLLDVMTHIAKLSNRYKEELVLSISLRPLLSGIT